jgi:hypothetical protein
MNPLDQWFNEFFKNRGLTKQDGRPLYAYRCSEAEFTWVGEYLKITHAYYAKLPPSNWNQAFCLYASEWWRRHHEGGPWKWEGILAAIGVEEWMPTESGYSVLQDAVADGLRRWQRPLLKSQIGRLFLVTLACEGGLPLKLVLREQARLRAYFRALLELFHRYREVEVNRAELAESEASILPRTLRHDIVYQLSGQLIEKVLELQQRVAESSDPVQSLDRLYPDWREDLPLAVEDDVARAFLNSLIREAGTVSSRGVRRIRWMRLLRCIDSQWHLVGQLDLPARMKALDIQHLFAIESSEEEQLPGRFELGIETEGQGYETLALASARQGRDGEREYVLEHYRRSTNERFGEQVAAGRVLVAMLGKQTVRAGDYFGAGGLSELPWTFELVASDELNLKFVGEGSTRVRSKTAVVAIPHGSELVADEGAFVEQVGRIEGLGRRLYKLTGSARIVIREAETGQYVQSLVRTGDRNALKACQYLLRGSRPFPSRYLRDVFAGVPSVWMQLEDGSLQKAKGVVKWRPLQGRHNWRRDIQNCIGDVGIRFENEGQLHFSSRAKILPERTRIKLKVERVKLRLEGIEGIIEFHNIGHPHVRQQSEQAGLEFVPYELEENHGMGLRLAVGPSPPDSIHVELFWQGDEILDADRCLALVLPFPVADGRFRDGAGILLQNATSVCVRNLAGVSAEAVIPKHNAIANLEGHFSGNDIPIELYEQFKLHERMEKAEEGRFEYELVAIRERLEAQLDVTDDIDGRFILRVQSNEAAKMRSASLYVTRFDVELRFDKDRGVISSAEERSCDDSLDLSSMKLECFPLTEVGPERLPLTRCEEGHWELPWTGMRPGPWLVIAWDGDWCRARPCLVPVPSSDLPGEDSAGETSSDQTENVEQFKTLAECSNIPRRSERIVGFQKSLSEMAFLGDHPDWELVEEHLAWCRELPPVTFDIVTSLAKIPEAAAMLAYRINPEDFQNLWIKLDRLPFMWCLVPVKAWEGVLGRYVDKMAADLDALSGDLGDLDPAALLEEHFDKATRKAIDAQPSLQAVLQILGARLLKRELAPEVAFTMNTDGERYFLSERKKAREALMQRHPNFYQWPKSDLPARMNERLMSDKVFVEALPGWHTFKVSCDYPEKSALLNAPVFAALLALTDKSVWRDEEVIGEWVNEFKKLRRYDEAWFDEAYHYTFLAAFGTLKEREES